MGSQHGVGTEADSALISGGLLIFALREWMRVSHCSVNDGIIRG
jgi:hypothetical protein